ATRPGRLRDVGPELPGRLHRAVFGLHAVRDLPEVVAIGVEVVGREALLDSPERPAPAELVGVVDELAVALLAERREGLRRAAGVSVDGAPLGGPGDVVVARATNRSDLARDVLL